MRCTGLTNTLTLWRLGIVESLRHLTPGSYLSTFLALSAVWLTSHKSKVEHTKKRRFVFFFFVFFDVFFFVFFDFFDVFSLFFWVLQSIFGKFEICNPYIFHTFVIF